MVLWSAVRALRVGGNDVLVQNLPGPPSHVGFVGCITIGRFAAACVNNIMDG